MAARGIRESARDLAFQALFMLGEGGATLDTLLSAEWYKEAAGFGDEGGLLLPVAPEITESVRKVYHDLLSGTYSNLERIDTILKEHLVNWDFDRLHAVDKAILRLSIYSLIYCYDMPAEVVISEANELSDTYADENTAYYINGILNKIKENIRKSPFDKKEEARPVLKIKRKSASK